MASTARSARGFLPLITENRNLVSPSPSSRATPQKDPVLYWVDATKRRIQEKLVANPGDEAAVTLSVLKQELVAVFIEVLQKKDRNSWKFLSEVLLHMKAYQNYLSVASQEICHYVERIFTYMDIHKEEFFDLDIADSLQLIFPKAVEHIRSQRSLKKSSQSYSPLATPKSKPSDRLLKRKLPSLTLPDGTNPYKTELTMDFHRPIQKFLTFGDLDSTVADVALQTATREAIWNACLGTTALALSVQLPPGPDHIVPPVASDVLMTVSESFAESSDDEVLETLREEKAEEISTPMNGREAVEHFAKCHHLGKIQFMYFNLAPNRHFRPYDVVEVSKDKVKREHYIFSTFGVLHVIGGDHSESMSLAEWQRDAVLWAAASKIPFFKNYLIRKTFLRWRANVRFQRFAKVRHEVGVHLLSSMPCYGAALHQVLRLCQELLLVHFLPLTNSKCYQLSEFELAISSAQRDAADILEKFFRFQKVIINTVREELLKRISQHEAQPQSSLLVSKESHYLHNVKKQQKKDILKQLKHEASFFSTFVSLVKKILLSYLVHLAQDNISLFVESFVSLSGSREAYFTTSLTFSSENDMLCLSPPTEMFSDLISKMFRDIPSFLIRSAASLEEDEAMEDRQSGDHQESTPQRFRRGTVLKEDESDFVGALSTRSEGMPEGSILGNSTADAC